MGKRHMGQAPNLGACEYLFSRGHGTRDRALGVIEDAFAAGTVSPCEKPRVVAYTNGDGARRYAVAVTNTAMEDVAQRL